MPQRVGLSAFAVLLALGQAATPARSDNALIAAAKAEGRVVWYTTLIINQFVNPAAAAFEKKYGIRVEAVRSDGSSLVLRLLNEAKAQRYEGDMFDNTDTSPALKQADAILKWTPEPGVALPKQFYDPNGYWVASNLYALSPGVNTDLVKPGDEPRRLDDLLDPKWRGKMAWSGNSRSAGAVGFVGLVLKEMGEPRGMDYLRRLAPQKITALEVSARQVLDQVIAGEFAMGLQTFNNHSVISADTGAPVRWVRMEPSMGLYSVFSVAKGAPHVNAAKLLVEFLISKEGQELFRAADYIPVSPEVPPRDPGLRPDTGGFRAIFFTPDDMEATIAQRQRIYGEIFK